MSFEKNEFLTRLNQDKNFELRFNHAPDSALSEYGLCINKEAAKELGEFLTGKLTVNNWNPMYKADIRKLEII